MPVAALRDRAPRTRFVRQPPSLVGLGVAAPFYAAALLPSLLPRPLTFLIVLAALGTVGGYALGAVVSWLLNLIPWIRAHHLPRRWTITIVVLLWIPPLAFTPIAIGWQAEQQSELDMPGALPGAISLVLATALVSVLFLVIGRSVRLGVAALARALGHVPGIRALGARGLRLSVAVGLVAGAAALVNVGFAQLVSSYGTRNADASGQDPSTVGPNSGGAESLVAWQTLGREGRHFVSNALTPAEITEVTGRPAVAPLRLYVGMEQGSTPQERSDLAVAEIDRSGAWDREYLAIFTVTGTGWVDPNGVNALELVAGGDIATVAVQYSATPSWIGFVVDQQTSMEQGASQVQTIVDAWRRQPADSRPELILFGQSLGAFGSQAAWPVDATPADVVSDISKVIWIGPPAQSRLWERWQALRTAGPAWQPVIGDGMLAKVYVTPGEIAAADAATGPRITYAAHANDPVVYWSPSLFLDEPAWSRAPLGPGVDPHFRWFPGITYLSLGFDLISGGEPPEVGHNYSANIGPAVAVTVAPPDWTSQDTARMQEALPRLAYPTG